VWIVTATLNAGPPARFLVDTGASLTLVSPALARRLALVPQAPSATTALQTVAGSTSGAPTSVASIRVGTADARNVPAVIHEPGLDVDGILGNSFLSRFRVTFDAGRHLLHLRPLSP
jgi:aspartyl protease family protein